MRHIILSTQHVLQQIQDRQIADVSMFEADIEITPGDKDRWYGTHVSYLCNTMIPKLKAMWELEIDDQEMNGSSNALTSFDFTEREVMWAFSNYSDAVGPVLRRQPAMYATTAIR